MEEQQSRLIRRKQVRFGISSSDSADYGAS
jgi:hypothetical protein